jgi:lipoyl(octanoyl) transferase
MKFIDLGLVKYERFLQTQNYLHKRAIRENNEYTLFASHYPIFTKGLNEKNFEFALRVDRGGSVTYFDEGSFMIYFIHKVSIPSFFYKKVIKSLKEFFSFDKNIAFDSKKAGFYIKNRKICSLGFAYKKGYSKHGVSVHLNNNLKNFNKINPCNLEGIKATTLHNEGYEFSREEVKNKILTILRKNF